MGAAAGRGGHWWRRSGLPVLGVCLRTALAVLGLALGLAACGGGDGGVKPSITQVVVSPAAPVVPFNGTQQFTAEAVYSDGSAVALSTGVTWSSSAASVLSVVANTGLGTGRAEGTATVSAAFGGVTGSVSVRVQAAFVEVAMGEKHALGVKEDGTLWAWGRNNWGQLGIGSSGDSSVPVPVRVGTDKNWSKVAVGAWHSLAIRTDGTLWAWGLNQNGQLGVGDVEPRLSPAKVGTTSTWFSLAAGGSHSVARQKDGKLFTWGRNHFGQLGHGNSLDRRSPTEVPAPTGSSSTAKWDAITAAADHTLAIRTDGTLWAWGRNDVSQLGPSGAEGTVNVPTLVDFEEPSWYWIAVSTGPTHTLAVRSDGVLYSWGSAANGRLGRSANGATASPAQVGEFEDWVKVSAGGAHSLAIRQGGTLWSWGANDRGQLGDGGAVTERSFPAQVVIPQVSTTLTWTDVWAGFNSSSARTSANALWTWGDDTHGQLGVGGSGSTGQQQLSPVKVN